MRALFSIAVLGISLLATPVLAQAAGDSTEDDPVTRAEGHSRRGVEFYNAGKYPEAIREMLAAYQAVPDSMLLYNVARIYQAMGQRELAVDYFTRFVRVDGADPDTVQQALEHMAELQVETPPAGDLQPAGVASAVDADAGGGADDSGGASMSAGQGNEAPTGGPGEPVAADAGPSARSVVAGRDGLGKAPAVFVGVAAGAGLALAVTGVLAGVHKTQSLDESLTYEERLAASDTAAVLAIGADISLGVHAGAAVTAGILALAAKARRDRAAIVPAGPRGSLGFVVFGEFGPPRRAHR